MRLRVLLLLALPLLLLACGQNQPAPKAGSDCPVTKGAFKTAQLKVPRVRDAYTEKEASIKNLLGQKGICPGTLELYIRAFKADKVMEVWAKNNTDDKFQLLTTYAICKSSGVLGPKRKDGDRQVPEGFYHIADFNPASRFYLSLGLNYPNKADVLLGDKEPGNEIYIHGDCVTIGCMPLTDEVIKELYILCVEAKSNGQDRIPVHIFPSKLIGSPNALVSASSGYAKLLPFWKSLLPAYDYFEKNRKLPLVSIDSEGNYVVRGS